MPGEDRLTALCEQPVKRVTGIDFVQIVDPQDQRVMHVYFIVDPETLQAPTLKFSEDAIETEQISIISISGGERLAEIVVESVTNAVGDESRNILEITVREPGDFSRYRLAIADDRVDRFFNLVEFSFKQGCPTDLDCEIPPHECPPEQMVDFPVDYLARDFVSIRNALLDFAAQRYPDWTEKIEADAGVMLAEVMAALGDEFAYIQDRYAREAYLETASQRRSLDRHTRLVDYNIHDGLTATTFLDLAVKGTGGTFVDAGSRVWAPGQGEPPIPFELGSGLADTTADAGMPRRFWVHTDWNELPVHLPDDDEPCLPVGATELYLRDTLPITDQVPGGVDPVRFWVGKWLLLKTLPGDASVPARRHLVRVTAVEHTSDPLCLDGSGNPIAVTRVRWEEAQALPFEMCLRDMSVHGNIVPATAGETHTEFFRIRENKNIPLDKLDGVPRAIERQGPLDEITCRRSVTFLSSLTQTESLGLGWLSELREAEPEVELQEVDPVNLLPLSEPRFWQWRRSLLESRGFEEDFTLEHGTWRRIIGFQRIGEIIEHQDYASGAGFTLRFGDNEFGASPRDETVFRVRYRTGPGTKANLPADTVVSLTNPLDETESDLDGVLDDASNPLPVNSGINPEDPQVFKHLAPEAFRALPLRAVRADDYQAISERLPWVQRAGAQFRWTGSWLSAFVTPDPLGAFELSADRRTELENLIDCVRQAGREAFVRDPRFVNIDLEIRICVEPFAYAGQVKEHVTEALTGNRGAAPRKGFLDPDNFTFGMPLLRAALEAAIQAVPGVRGVDGMQIRARGITAKRPFSELVFEVGDDQVIRLQNDPRFPERGSLRIITLVEEPA